jgi:hypothetical protein
MASRSPVPEDIRKAYIEEGLKLREQGKAQADLEYNGVKYFLDNKGEKWGGWRLRNRGSHSAQGSKRRAKQREAVPTKADYQKVYGGRKGAEMFALYKKEMNRIWATRGTRGMDVDHMNSLASGGIEHPLNMRLQESSRNRSEGARKLTPSEKTSLMLADNITDQISVQGPKPTPRQRQDIFEGFRRQRRILQFGGQSDFLPSIQDEFDATPGIGHPLEGGREFQAGDFTFMGV